MVQRHAAKTGAKRATIIGTINDSILTGFAVGFKMLFTALAA